MFWPVDIAVGTPSRQIGILVDKPVGIYVDQMLEGLLFHYLPVLIGMYTGDIFGAAIFAIPVVTFVIASIGPEKHGIHCEIILG